MTTAGFFDRFQLVVLSCWLGLGVWRMFRQYARGGRVVAIDRERTVAEQSKDLLAAFCMVSWWYEVVAQAWPLQFHIVPAVLRAVVVDAGPLKAAGVVLWLLALTVYALAMQQMADSWRIGIDRKAPGMLVTGGIFGRSRNPIYLSFDLAVFATFFVSGRLHFLLLGLLLAVLLHDQIRREERFLARVHGERYLHYCNQVRRYG